jgi:uncharacterized membrane-anchored protein
VIDIPTEFFVLAWVFTWTAVAGESFRLFRRYQKDYQAAVKEKKPSILRIIAAGNARRVLLYGLFAAIYAMVGVSYLIQFFPEWSTALLIVGAVIFAVAIRLDAADDEAIRSAARYSR